MIIQLKKHRQKKDGTYPIVIQLHIDGKQKYIYVGHSVLEEDWDNKKFVLRTHPDYKLINAAIETKRRIIVDNLAEFEKQNKPINLDLIDQIPEVRSFSNYLQKRLRYFTDKGNTNMKYKVNQDIREIEAVNGGEVFYTDLTVSLLKKLEVYLKKEGNSQNTIARKFKNYGTHYAAAMSEDNAPAPNPFKWIKIKREPVKRNKLVYEQIIAIENLKLSGKIDVARDMFLFSYYCQGMRFENVLKLRKDQIVDGKIKYQMNKGKKHRAIGIHEKLEPIVNKYIDTPGRYLFPLLEDKEYTPEELYHKKGSENADINAYLKLIGVSAGIDVPVHFHMSKHSFAWRFATVKGGQDMDVLKDALGHSNYQTMQLYLKSLDESYIDEKVKDIF